MTTLQDLHGMPLAYNNAEEEYRLAREGAVVFDFSKRAKVSLTGPEAFFFLHNLCTNEVRNLKPGEGCEAFLTTAKAKIVAHVFVTNVSETDETKLLIDAVPGQADTLMKHLDHYLISEQVELADETDSVALFHLCGPKTQDLIDALSPKTKAANNKRVGLQGFDLVVSAEKAAELQSAFASAGTAPAGAQAFEWLRVEAGIPVLGRDLDDKRFVMEVGRTEQAISFSKGCFLGQEPIVMARDRGQVNRRFVGVCFMEGEEISIETPIAHNGEEVGRVTSSVISPKLRCPIALTYLKRGSHEPGTSVTADGREGVVTALPFVT